jgi:hypothetical protein
MLSVPAPADGATRYQPAICDKYFKVDTEACYNNTPNNKPTTIYTMLSRDSSVDTVTRLQAGQPGIVVQFPAETRGLTVVQK